MRKYYVILLLLVILNVISYMILNKMISNQITYEYQYQLDPILIQYNDIVLAKIDNFNFDDYFNVLTFNDESYKCSFDETNDILDIYLKQTSITLSFKYKLIEPKVITETKYITETIYIDNSDYCDYEDHHIYYQNDYYEFALGTDLSKIISIVQDDIVSYTNVTCDYSCLNPYELGEYSIYFYNNYEEITKIIKII